MTRSQRIVCSGGLLILSIATIPKPAHSAEPCGRVIVTTRYCLKVEVENCVAWSRAPVKLVGARRDRQVRNDRDLVRRMGYSDSTGVAIFDCVPYGTYAVSALWIGSVKDHSFNWTMQTSQGSGDLDEGWEEAGGDSIVVNGAEIRTTVTRRYNFGSRSMYR